MSRRLWLQRMKDLAALVSATNALHDPQAASEIHRRGTFLVVERRLMGASYDIPDECFDMYVMLARWGWYTKVSQRCMDALAEMGLPLLQPPPAYGYQPYAP